MICIFFYKICACIVGSPSGDVWRFLEDGLGTEDWHNCYDDPPRRKVKGKKMFLLDKSHYLLVNCSFCGNVYYRT